jgi:hypothetical protein
MADYKQNGNRYTMVLIRHPQHGGGELFERAGFDLVRFNVDTYPDSEAVIVPLGQDRGNESGTKPDGPKLYERIWVVDTLPFRPSSDGKIYFGGMPE